MAIISASNRVKNYRASSKNQIKNSNQKKSKSKEQSRNLNKDFCKCSRFSKVNLQKKLIIYIR